MILIVIIFWHTVFWWEEMIKNLYKHRDQMMVYLSLTQLYQAIVQLSNYLQEKHCFLFPFVL